MPQAATAVPEAGLDLQILRTEIDRIDTQLLELMETRLDCSAAIAAAKAQDDDAQLRLRPAREQQVIDRLVRRAGSMPAPAITAIWRELMGANLQAQGGVNIVVHCPEQPVLVLGDGSLRRRSKAGEQVKTLAMCGNLRLCVSHWAGETR